MTKAAKAPKVSITKRLGLIEKRLESLVATLETVIKGSKDINNKAKGPDVSVGPTTSSIRYEIKGLKDRYDIPVEDRFWSFLLGAINPKDRESLVSWMNVLYGKWASVGETVIIVVMPVLEICVSREGADYGFIPGMARSVDIFKFFKYRVNIDDNLELLNVVSDPSNGAIIVYRDDDILEM